jgi:hypothetical protein
MRDPKEAFLRRVVERAGVDASQPGRFACGHLQRLGKEHLAAGKNYPYGAQDTELLGCIVCEPEEACPDHDLAREIAQLARGEIEAISDPSARLEEWREFSWRNGGTVCDDCVGTPPVVLSFFCNEEGQITGFREWSALKRYLADQLELVAEDPESYDPEPVNGTRDELAVWYRKLIQIAIENEDPSDSAADWVFGLQVMVSDEHSYALLQSWDLFQGFGVGVERAFPTLEQALAFRASWGADDLAAVSTETILGLK